MAAVLQNSEIPLNRLVQTSQLVLLYCHPMCFKIKVFYEYLLQGREALCKGRDSGSGARRSGPKNWSTEHCVACVVGGGRQLYLPLEPVVSSDLMSTGATSELMSLFTSEPEWLLTS